MRSDECLRSKQPRLLRLVEEKHNGPIEASPGDKRTQQLQEHCRLHAVVAGAGAVAYCVIVGRDQHRQRLSPIATAHCLARAPGGALALATRRCYTHRTRNNTHGNVVEAIKCVRHGLVGEIAEAARCRRRKHLDREERGIRSFDDGVDGVHQKSARVKRRVVEGKAADRPAARPDGGVGVLVRKINNRLQIGKDTLFRKLRRSCRCRDGPGQDARREHNDCQSKGNVHGRVTPLAKRANVHVEVAICPRRRRRTGCLVAPARLGASTVTYTPHPPSKQINKPKMLRPRRSHSKDSGTTFKPHVLCVDT
eukprot:Opistho-2@10801